MKVLQAAGIQPDEVRVKALVAAVKNINIEEAIKTAAIIPTTPIAAPAAPTAPSAAPAAEAKAEEKKVEEKKAEEKKEAEEEIAAGLASLFG